MAYAGLFAAEGRWGLAKILAERSFRLRYGAPSRHSSSNKHVTGREAAYFAAVALRNSANKLQDFDLANRWIETAQQCWQKDKADRPELKVRGIRFNSERAAIIAARLFFQIFMANSNAEKNRQLGELVELRAEFKNLLSTILKEIRNPTSLDQHELWIHQNLERRTLVNLLMNWIVAKYFFNEEINESNWTEVKQYHALLAANVSTLASPSIAENYLYNLIWLISSLWLDSKNFEVRKAAEAQLTDDKIEAHSVMPYDRRRLNFFREVLAKIS